MAIVEGAVHLVAEIQYVTRGWQVVIELKPWTDGSTVYAKKSLRIEARANAATRARVTRQMASATVVRASIGRLKEDDYSWTASFKLLARRVKGSPDLLAAIAGRAQPTTVRDPVLGRLKIDRQLNCLDGKTEVWGKRRRLSVEAGTDRDAAIADAKKALAWIESSRTKIEKAVVAKFFPLYDDDWREDRLRITKEQFLARIAVESVVAHGDGLATLYLKAGSLFGGHGIDVGIRGGKVSKLALAG
jgi:hypothetical protein